MEIPKGIRLSVMLGWVATAHAGQLDKAGQPYVLHAIRVMLKLNSQDEELQCIALGHDLLEDTWVTEAHLRSDGFSERVIDGIVGLTKVKGQSYEDYQQQVLASKDRMLVKLADLSDNSNLTRLTSVDITITEKDVKRQVRYLSFIDLINEKLQSNYI